MAKQPDRGWREHVLSSLPTMEATTEPATATVTAQPPFSAGIHIAPSFDVIELLPEERKDLLRQVRQRSADAHSLCVPFEDIHQQSTAKAEAENALKRLVSHPHDFGFGLKPDDPRVIAAEKHREKMTADFKRLTELREVRSAAWQIASAALTNVESWLRHGLPGNTTLEAVETEPPKLNKGETVLDGIDRLRRRGRELKADLHRIASAPYPSSYAKQQMRAQIEALAMQGAPSVSALIELDGRIEFQTQRLQSDVFCAERRGLAFAQVLNIALVAWLHKDALIAALDREIASEADDKAALSHEARQQREAEVMGDLLAVERDECALVWQAQEQGLPVEHRGDISPLALLGLEWSRYRAQTRRHRHRSALPSTSSAGGDDRDARPLRLRANSAGMDAQRGGTSVLRAPLSQDRAAGIGCSAARETRDGPIPAKGQPSRQGRDGTGARPSQPVYRGGLRDAPMPRKPIALD